MAPLALPPVVNVAHGVVPPVLVCVVLSGGVVVSQTVPVCIKVLWYAVIQCLVYFSKDWIRKIIFNINLTLTVSPWLIPVIIAWCCTPQLVIIINCNALVVCNRFIRKWKCTHCTISISTSGESCTWCGASCTSLDSAGLSGAFWRSSCITDCACQYWKHSFERHSTILQVKLIQTYFGFTLTKVLYSNSLSFISSWWSHGRLIFFQVKMFSWSGNHD